MAGVFRDREGIVRLVGSVFSGQHDEWQAGRRSMPVESIEKAMQPAPLIGDGLDQGGGLRLWPTE